MTAPRDSSQARALPPVEATLHADPPSPVDPHAATYRPDVDGLRAIAVDADATTLPLLLPGHYTQTARSALWALAPHPTSSSSTTPATSMRRTRRS